MKFACKVWIGLLLWVAGRALVCGALAGTDAFDPPALYLTWQRDPATTMTIQWHTVDEAKAEVYFRRRGEADWGKGQGSSHPLPCSLRTVHTVELTGLEPRRDYEFCFWPGERRFGFRTMPVDLREPVRFVTGGDMYHERKWLDGMNELAGKMDPAFVLIGGDLAYSCEGKVKPEKMERWEAFFDSWKQKARSRDGRLVPLVVTIGNHEVHGSWNQKPEMGAVFYALFAMPGPRGYNQLDFRDYLSLLLLDSGHTHPVAGEQTEWLRETLAGRRKVAHIFPVYHVPAYPSYRSDEKGDSAKLTQEIRAHWLPLFEEAGVRVAFENHDHAYKRSKPIRAGKVDPEGITFLGDGAWGVDVRVPDRSQPRWYIERSEAVRHFFVVTLFAEARHIVAMDEGGRIFDEVYQRVR